MRAPPGYTLVNSDGCEEIWKLHKAIYGLKQASNAFWNAIHPHHIEKGFESILGDLCLFRRVALDGSVFLVCTYMTMLLMLSLVREQLIFSCLNCASDLLLMNVKENLLIGSLVWLCRKI